MYSPSFPAFPPGDVRHPAGVHVRRDAGLPASRHVAVDLHRVVHHAQVGVDPVVPVFDLRMAVVEILASSSGIVPGAGRLLDLLQLYPHVVDVRVDSDQVDITVLLRSGSFIDCISSGFSLGSGRSISLEQDIRWKEGKFSRRSRWSRCTR